MHSANEKAQEELCKDLNIADGIKPANTLDKVVIFREDKYWIVEDFPRKPTVTKSGISSKKWKGFTPNPDAVMIVSEGHYLRNYMFSFHHQFYSKWKPDNENEIILRKWFQPEKRFGSILHNGNFDYPIAVGFDKSWV
jgi:hypothetical protein